MISEISPLKKVHPQVEERPILKSESDIRYEWPPSKLGEDLFFVEDRLYPIF